MSEGKIQLVGLSFEELEQWTLGQKQPRFRAKQLYGWLMKGAAFSEMTNLPAAFREVLEREALANPVRIERCVKSKLDGTEKFLYALEDGNLIEGVLMRYHHGNTLCLSTQVGCKMGCAFCASTLNGCVRNLTSGEMLGQVLCANRHLSETAPGEKVGNIVLMGSGEPLDNYENTLKFLRLALDERGLNQSARGISLSTCGLVPRIYQLAEEGIPLTLSLSLHAPNDGIRARLMPITRSYSMDQVLEACRHYVEKTGRRVIFEYALVRDINSDLRHADELAHKLRNLQCHVNVIPLNDVPERNLRAPDTHTVQAFLNRLALRHISATRRREMGDDIQGACGQLRRHAMEEMGKPTSGEE